MALTLFFQEEEVNFPSEGSREKRKMLLPALLHAHCAKSHLKLSKNKENMSNPITTDTTSNRVSEEPQP
jgi:hypothetical protein